MDQHQIIKDIFGVNRALIGVIHVGGLPGTPSHHRSLPEIIETAVAEAHLYVSAGFHGVVIENTHDRPYLKGAVGPEIIASMAVIGHEIRRALPSAPLGVQILAGANQAALAVALACDASFVRVEGFVFAHVADEGIIESSAASLLRYRRTIGAEGIRVFADIKKKHSAHALTADVSLVETAKAAEFFLVDGVIVTGISHRSTYRRRRSARRRIGHQRPRPRRLRHHLGKSRRLRCRRCADRGIRREARRRVVEPAR